MTKAITNSARKAGGGIKKRIKQIIRSLGPNIPPSLHNALRSVIDAVEYGDKAVVDSHMLTALHEFAKVLDEASRARLTRRWPELAEETCAAVLQDLEGECVPGEWVDDIGQRIDNMFARILEPLESLLGSIDLYEKHGVPVPSSESLRATVGKLKGLRKRYLSDWPWTHLPVATDRELLKKSRTERVTGIEPIPVGDLITQLGGSAGDLRGSAG